MRVVLGLTLDFAALVEVVMHHTFDETSFFLLCYVYTYGFGFGFIKLK